MNEVEIKIRNIDKDKIIKEIEALGAKKNFTGRVIDSRYDTPDRRLSKQGKALRIRQKGRHIYLNLKGRKKSVDSITQRDEIGVKLSNSRIMNRILNDLGYVKIFELNKYRTEYKLEDVKFDIDEYIGMTPMLEIESTNVEKVQEYLKKFDFTEEQMARLYIREILAAKKKVDEQKMLKQNFKE